MSPAEPAVTDRAPIHAGLQGDAPAETARRTTLVQGEQDRDTIFKVKPPRHRAELRACRSESPRPLRRVKGRRPGGLTI